MKRDERGRVVSEVKYIKGDKHRLCSGPAHDEPVWLPETEKYFYKHKTGRRMGKFTNRCRLCVNWNKLKSPGESGTVPVSEVQSYFIEGVRRVGMMEFCRRTGLTQTTMRDVTLGRQMRVQKRTVRKVMLEVISIRRKGEVRHKDSIRAGARLRGRNEKEVKSKRDLYQPEGDKEMERGRRRRAAAL